MLPLMRKLKFGIFYIMLINLNFPLTKVGLYLENSIV